MTRREKSQEDTLCLQGTGISPGFSVGTVHQVEARTPSFYRIRIIEAEVDRELQRLRRALDRTRRQLLRVKEYFEAQVGKEHSYILDAHLLILEDEILLQEIRARIARGLESAERAVRNAAEGWLSVYRSLPDPYFRERGSDFEEVVERIVHNLTELDPPSPPELAAEVILVAPEIGLSVLANYPLDRVRGLVLGRAGKTSHVAIIARSCQIPAVAGIDQISLLSTGDLVVVDGNRGAVRKVAPEELERYRAKAEESRLQRGRQEPGDQTPCMTRDGRRVYLYANTEVGTEVAGAIQLGAEGIGLFRSEYIYMNFQKGPVGEEEQFEIYKRLAETAAGRPAVIRTFDLSESRFQQGEARAGDEGDTLGIRGIRLTLRHPELFDAQLRAILRASLYGNLKILLPMVSSVDEVLASRERLDRIRQELLRQGLSVPEVPLGVMLEVPAILVILESLLPHLDFLSVGSNDLVQYLLAADRRDEKMADLYDPLHPAVLRSLARVAEVSENAGVEAFVCGEIAAQPAYAGLLVGMGFRHLSMNPFSILEVKRAIGGCTYRRLEETVQELLHLDTVREVREAVEAAGIPHPRAELSLERERG